MGDAEAITAPVVGLSANEFLVAAVPSPSGKLPEGNWFPIQTYYAKTIRIQNERSIMDE